jgi:tetratricopeptide (TPR) repeat protein
MLKSKMLKRRLFQRALPVFVIALLGVLAYSNTFQVPFQLDDDTYIRENPLTRDFGYFGRLTKPDGHQELTDVRLNLRTRYIAFLTFRANYMLGGFTPVGYHVVNLTVHIINALLVYAFALLLFATPALESSRLKQHAGKIAFLASLLFVAHPVQTQAVTYISQRFASLATLFYVLSLTTYLRSRLSTGNARYIFFALSVVSAIAAMKTKEISFTLPLVIALAEFMFFKGSIRRRIILLTPLLLTMLIIPLSLIDIERPLGEAIGDSTKTQETISRQSYLITQPRVLVTYLRLLVLPINQNLDYDYPVFGSPFTPEVFVSCVLLLAIAGLGAYCLARCRSSSLDLRLVAFGVFWFFITLSVESSVIALADVIFEHRLYLPSVGIFSAAATGAFMLFGRLRGNKPGIPAAALLVLVPLVFACATYARNNVWATQLGLWSDVVRKSPSQVRAHGNVARAYQDMGLLDKAIEHYRLALKLNPDIAEAHNNLGNIYHTMGQTGEAIKHFNRAISLKPNLTMAYYNLGIIHLNNGQFDMAIKNFKTALKLNPYHSETHNNLGVAYSNKGLSGMAVEHFKTALKLKPENAGARHNLRLEYERRGITGEPEEGFR